MEKVNIVAVVGKSNSGKTTLLEQLVAVLTRKGYQIGTVKHAHSKLKMDTPGKDSWRHRQAGAAATLVLSDDQVVLIKDDQHSPLEKMLTYLADQDLILVEGFKHMNIPKIEVFRKDGPHKKPLYLDPEIGQSNTIKALVTDDAVTVKDIPVFELNDINTVADFIETRYLSKEVM
jgi:molybdopterin-guanine dinucleotide biosynthesis protein B